MSGVGVCRCLCFSGVAGLYFDCKELVWPEKAGIDTHTHILFSMHKGPSVLPWPRLGA